MVEEVRVFSEEFTTESAELLEKYPEKPLRTKLSIGYKVKDGDPKIQVPDLGVLKYLDKALDYIDGGRSFREAAEWLSSRIETQVSHTGLKKIWERERPNGRAKLNKKKEKERAKRRPLTPLERLERLKKKKIAAEKRRITFAKKRLGGLTEEVEEIQEVQNNPVIKIDYSLLDKSSLDEELKDVEPIFEPNPGPQTEFLSAPQLEVLYGGAAGGGKSYAMLADPMRWFGNKHFNGLLLRRTNDELRELVWKSRELYKAAYPTAEFGIKSSTWVFPSGARLWMSYLERDEDVLRYVGQAFTWIGIDELTQYATPFAWNFLRSRLRSTDPEMSKNLAMRATTNPGGPGHGWVKKMFIDPAPPNQPFWATDIETGETIVYPKGHEKAGQPVFRRRFIPASLYDNPYLTRDSMYEANLMALPEQQRRQLLEGDWDVADGAAFKEFRKHVHTCESFNIPSSWRRFRSCDYGYSSHAAVHWYAIDPDGTLYVYRELYTRLMEAPEFARKVLELERGERIDYGVLDSSLWAKRGDPGPSIAERMIMQGCRWRPSDRSPGARVAGKNRLHELLKVNPETNKPGIIFFNTCRQIISDLPVIPSDPNGGEDIDDRYASDHAYDSIRYGIMTRPHPNTPWETMQNAKIQDHGRPVDQVFGY